MKKLLIISITLTLGFNVFSQTLEGTYLDPKGDDGDPYKWIRFGNQSDFYAGFMWNNTTISYGDGDDFSIFTYNNRDITLKTGSGNVSIFPSGMGKIGVGTRSPGYILDINDRTNSNYLFRLRENDAPSDHFRIYNTTWADNQFIPFLQGYHDSDNRVALIIGGAISEATDNGNRAVVKFDARKQDGNNFVETRPLFEWQNYSASKMTMLANGNLGIGTTNPKAKLSVNGTIVSQEIKVLTDISQYPDFVFSEGYELRTINEVAGFIEEYGHLPEIPKAEEVKEGLPLGEMNTKLLQKIEELTLYTIAQQKELEKQAATIEALKEQNAQIEKLKKQNEQIMELLKVSR